MSEPTTFEDLNLSTPIHKALYDLGFVYPTLIQQKVFSTVMSGRDVLGIAQTGTGKTFAYLLPCVRLWKFSKERFPQVLILVPTRELVMQVVEEAKKLTTYQNIAVVGVYGGVNIKNHAAEVLDGCDILVATPGRLMDLALNGVLKLKAIKRLVIDEVDEMLNLGFRSQLNTIFDLLPEKRQNLLFSATLTYDVEQLIEVRFNNPEKIEAAATGTPLENIVQSYYQVPNFYTKINLLTYLLREDKAMTKVLVFTATKQLADDVFNEMNKIFAGNVGVIHSNKAQNNRFKTVKDFHEGNIRTLVATDIVARGLDISEVTHVINFDTPDLAESYMHRIGRTGRADKKGISITFTTDAERDFKNAIEELMNYEIPRKALPKDLFISEDLRDDELPVIHMKNIVTKHSKPDDGGGAFHEKLDKNKKVNKKVTREDIMKRKYGKPIAKGRKSFKK
jgi:ATP-dependent RNA helicase RhlE